MKESDNTYLPPRPSLQQPLKEGMDYYFNEKGQWVFTETYHLRRGYCCKSGCRHCPYGYKKEA